MFTLRKTTTAFAAAAFALALALLIGVLAVGKPAGAAPDVTPKSVDGNKTCADLGLGNYEFKLEGSQLKNGTYSSSDGYLTVELKNFTGLQSFDWLSKTIGVDAVIVKGGTGENAYVYDPPGPESMGDDRLVAPDGKDVSHISFCYDFELKVSKTADTSLTRTHNWSIDKSVTPDALDLFRGDSGEAEYTVEATRTGSTDSNWAVKGTITVSNPNPFTVAVERVVDQVSGLAAEQVTCTNASGATVPPSYQLKSGEQLSCPYSFNLSDASKRLNTATAFPAPLTGTPKVKSGSGTAPVDFGQATITEKNTSINVNDDLGTPDDESDDKTFAFSGNGGSADPYKLTFNCDEDSGTHTNTASATILNPDGTTKVVSDDASVTVNCHELDVSKTADTSFTRTQNWDIEKTVNPETLDLFRGDSDEAEYTVKATNTGSTDSDHEVSGTITIENPAPIAAPLAGVTDALEDGTAANNVDCGGAQSVPANGQLQCSYSIDLNAPTDSTNIATAELKNNTGTTTSFTGEAEVDFGSATVTPVNDSINVNDDLGTTDTGDDKAFSFSGNGSSETYELTFDCDEDSAPSTTYKNTATIQETKQSDDASVEVNCYDLAVSKTADTSLTRTHNWDIEKSVDPETLNLFRGDSGDANYTIEATRTGSEDSDWAVSGTITINNPAPMEANLSGVTDKLDDEDVSVDCGGAQSVPANGQLQCTYNLELGDASERTNVATATLENGTGFSSGEVAVSFSNPNINPVNESINVDDSNGQSFSFDESGSKVYPTRFSCDENSASSTTYDNTATIRETGQSDDASVKVNCYDLAVSKTADTSLTRTYQWAIDKSVDRSTLDLFQGDSGKAKYTVSLDKTGSKDSDHEVSGTITIENPAPIAAPLAGVTDALEDGTAANNVDCGGAQSVPANGQLQCSYSIDLNAPTDSTNSTNIATATLENGTGFSGTANVDFDNATIDKINDSISVKDSFSGFGDPQTFSDDGSVSYDRTFDCNDGSKTYENVATIEQTGQSDDASVKVNCHTLSVSKDAKTSFTRTHSWNIDKSADKSELTLSPGQQFLVNYSVKVNSTSKDGDYAVSGKITVDNTTPIDANLKSVADQIEGIDSGATVDCGVSFPYTLKAGESLNCSYNSGLPNNDTRTNTATATLANNTGFSGTANVDFGNAAMKEIDEEITVTDAFNGGSPDTLGVVKANESPKTFDYTRNISSTDAKGDPPAVTNVAKFVTNDTKTPGSDSWTIKVNTPAKGCTLTVGYWKNHAGDASGSSGNQADMVTKHLPISLGTSGGKKSVNVTTATQAVSIFTKVDSSNGIEKLYAQLLAAKLNIKNGADGSAVAGTIKDADAFLATYNASNWSKLTKTDQQKVIDWAKKLDQYNNGEIGPGHCNE